MQIRTVPFEQLRDKTVLVRVDFNVPLKHDNNETTITDDLRLLRTIPTLKKLQESGAKTVLISHLGRPGGKPDPQLSLQPIADYLGEELDTPCQFISQVSGKDVDAAVTDAEGGSILLLENTRFDPREKENDSSLAEEWASFADYYINDAFSAAHRAHASTHAITEQLESFAGPQFIAEIEHLQKLSDEPKRPFVMIIGGKKISDKITAVTKLIPLADVVLVGGGVANNFLKASGHDIFASYTESEEEADLSRAGEDYVHVAAELIAATESQRMILDDYIPLPKIVTPLDVIAADSVTDGPDETTTIELTGNETAQAADDDLMYLDIGPRTIRLYKEIIKDAGTIFWNGPMGVFEKEPFQSGTKEIAHAIANASGYSVLGGGDTIAAIRDFELYDRYSYVSAAGGASLEFLSGKTLPAVKPLMKQ